LTIKLCRLMLTMTAPSILSCQNVGSVGFQDCSDPA
jgi:hypothetical protein